MVYSRQHPGDLKDVDSEIVKRLAWSGLVALTGAVASWLSFRASAIVWRRIFDEEPPV